MRPARATPGAISLSSSSHLPIISNADHFKIDKGKPSNVAARMCQARDEALADRIVNHREDDGDGSGGLLQRGDDWSALSDDQIRRRGHQLRGISAKTLGIAAGEPKVDPDIVRFR